MSGGLARTATKELGGQRPGLLKRPSGLGDEVYSVIFGQLMSLAIPPGARITVDTLARELGVSQTPIREALGRLEAEGLVVKTHLVGYSAAPQLTQRQFEELYELRLLLEPHAASRAAKMMSDEAIAALAGLGESVSAGSSEEPLVAYGQFARLDKAFHDLISLSGGNALVADTLGRLHTHVHLFRLMYHAAVTEEALSEHAAIVAAIRRRDGRGAAAAMRDHVERSRARFVATFKTESTAP